MRMHLDFETQSHLELSEVGSYAYCNHPSTRITHAAWRIEGAKETNLFQAHRDPELFMLWELYDTLQGVVAADIPRGVVAHNAAFELQVCLYTLTRMLGIDPSDFKLHPRHFDCTMARAFCMGLPGSLDQCAAALSMPVSKDKYGASMMKKHCKPSPFVDVNGQPLYWSEVDEDTYVSQSLQAFTEKLQHRKRQPKDSADLIEKRRIKLIEDFRAMDIDAELDAEGAYCATDVEVECAIDRWLPPLSASEFDTWVMDQEINLAGVPLNIPKIKLLNQAVTVILARADADIERVTEGQINRVTQATAIAAWLRGRGIPCDGVGKDKVDDLLLCAQMMGDDEAHEVIRLRALGGQTAVNKLPVMLTTADENGYSRNVLQYHGAATGRWSGRLWQPHNIKRLPEGAVETLDKLLENAGSADALIQAADALDIDLFGAIGDAMRSLLEDFKGPLYWVGGDFSNIEGRGNAWLADETWKIKAFQDYDLGIGFDLYKLAYARAFRLDPSEVDKDGRQRGKVMELALGFGGGVGAFQTMAKNYRLFVTDSEADKLKVGWREAHPAIVGGWYALQEAAVNAVRNPNQKQVCFDGKVVYMYDGNHLICRLPNKRLLMYPFARVEWRYFGEPAKNAENYAEFIAKAIKRGDQKSPVVLYKGVDSVSKKWGDKQLYGGLQCENLCQAVARDVLVDKMKAARKAGFDIRLHVHDEMQALDKDPGRVAELKALMIEPLPWCPGYPIAAECGADKRYVK